MAIVTISVARTQRSDRDALLVLREDGGEPVVWLIPIETMSPDELASKLEKFAAEIRKKGE